MLTSDNTAVVVASRLGLINAAPEEWRQKPAVNSDETEDPIRLFAQQLMGTAITPTETDMIPRISDTSGPGPGFGGGCM